VPHPIHIRRVEVLDAELDRGAQGLDVRRLVAAASVKIGHAHAAEAQAADLEGAVTERLAGVRHESRLLNTSLRSSSTTSTGLPASAN
jgi:hypothetical protein